MDSMSQSLMEQIENKYRQLTAEIDDFKVVFDKASPALQQKYRPRYDDLLHQQRIVQQRYEELQQAQGKNVDRFEYGADELFADIEQYLTQLKNSELYDGSGGWSQGQETHRERIS